MEKLSEAQHAYCQERAVEIGQAISLGCQDCMRELVDGGTPAVVAAGIGIEALMLSAAVALGAQLKTFPDMDAGDLAIASIERFCQLVAEHTGGEIVTVASDIPDISDTKH